MVNDERRGREEEEVRIILEREKERREREEAEQQAAEDKPLEIKFDMKPKDVKTALDKDVIRQDKAKKYLANAICYHYARIRRNQREGNGDDAFIKKNVLMLGNTGVGKTYLVSKVAKLVGVPFVKEDATKFSATGYVGRDVDDMVRDLWFAADKNTKLSQYGIVYIDEIDKIRRGDVFGKDVSGVEVQRGLLKLMEDYDVELISNYNPLAAAHAMNEMKKMKGKKPVINTKHILFIMAGAFPGLEKDVTKRLGLKTGKVDVEEAKDILGKHNFPGLQTMLEEEDGNGKWYDQLTSQDFIDYGFEPEFIGRLPIRVALDDLDENDLYSILKTSCDSVIRHYTNDFLDYGINLTFDDESLRVFAGMAAKDKIGARALTKVIEDTLFDFMYELPSTDVKELVVDSDLVEHPKERLVSLIMESSLENFFDDVYQKDGIKFILEKPAAYNLLAKKSVETGISPRDLCETMLEDYRNALKLYKQKEFTITSKVVSDPEKYLHNLMRKHTK